MYVGAGNKSGSPVPNLNSGSALPLYEDKWLYGICLGYIWEVIFKTRTMHILNNHNAVSMPTILAEKE